MTFPDFGWGATGGATREEALGEARDLLRELIATAIREGGDLPEPSSTDEQRSVVVPPAQIALKAALYDAWRQAGISRRQFARDLDVAESEVRRMLNPDHATKAATIDRATPPGQATQRFCQRGRLRRVQALARGRRVAFS
ncbi:MAG: type II toxin-antitoxin system HicB family antitoxin [Holophagales bacterium]|nr:type II toxin-antitoxin system HicB family antitoxin [Holophagales bacterium]MYG30893.1 type II toxin-antitoxin system HicB family antitoxin [Holophagales bacterium]MYI80368.1 type II toxin-antitoxin system HicB family antitoxin [Holophagales bacterium]